MKWETVCTPKHHGGLGLWDHEHANVVSGAKLWWRWVTHAQEPWVKICILSMLRDGVEEILYDSQKILLDPTYSEHHGWEGGWSRNIASGK